MSIYQDSSSELLKYFWPFPYPEHLPPFEVIFSNGLPESDNDTDHMVFQIPFSTFKTAVEALIAQSRQELLKRIELPELKNTKHSESIGTQAFGYNQALSEVAAILKQLKGEV